MDYRNIGNSKNYIRILHILNKITVSFNNLDTTVDCPYAEAKSL